MESRDFPALFMTPEIIPRYGWSGPYRLQFNCNLSAINVTRVNKGVCPFSIDHNYTMQIGAVDDIFVESDGVHANIRILPEGKNAAADNTYNLMQHEMRPGVSGEVDFAEEDVLLIDEDEVKGPLFFIGKWDVNGMSSVSRPALADAQVSLSKSAHETFGRVFLSYQSGKGGATQMDFNGVADKAQLEREKLQARWKSEYLDELQKESEAKAHKEEFEQMKVDLAKATKDNEDFIEKIRNIQYNPNPFNSNDGIDRSPNFSLGNLIRAKTFGDSKQSQRNAAVELEYLDKNPMESVTASSLGDVGPVIPHEKLWESGFLGDREQFAKNTGNIGSSVQTTVDHERAYQWLVDQADMVKYCQVIPGLTADLRIPVGTGTGVPPVFQVEGANPDVVDPAISSIHLQPREMVAKVQMTKKSIQQTGGWLDAFIRGELGRRFGERMNYEVMRGPGGANNITGVLNKTGVNEATYTGAAPKWSEFTNPLGLLKSRKVNVQGGAWAYAALLWGQLMGTVKDEGSGKYIVSDGEGMGNNPMHTTAGYPAVGTALLEANTAIFGSWYDSFVGLWAGMQLVIDPITDPLNVKITAIQWWDYQIPRGLAFVKLSMV